MTAIHLMCGFLGFGKTTIAKELEAKLSAKRFTHDDIMVERYGRNPDDFQKKFAIVDEYIRNEAKKCIKNGQDAILDYGFWTHQKREEYYQWAKGITDDVIFHLVECDLDEAKKRVVDRTESDSDALLIDENLFNLFLKQYEFWSEKDCFPAVLHNADISHYIGKTVMVHVDRPLGSKHPKFGFEYPINYGFLPFTKSGDGEEIDAYVLGIDKPIKDYIGKCTAVIHRKNDNDDKLIVAPENTDISDEEIEELTHFQEQWFEHVLITKADD